ncbi:amino acid ABC transporter permease [Paraburkholderia unamae]|uniref:Amino acid ABC transporter membrane protein 1 (PAAT family) n=1 Tax=Paraburkholderia unamae TaxID=219649 RepID=A0ABX5KBD6_9BURK|nr:amino acid ABC transporter permease [Paraburkholderia unamae]PVX72860.1 amino acid ABC transporter membrane protein 1 (PAAT family) [Paraburkholderia unamae]CAG9272627.1 Polar amino acid transport system permease protein [Paraburkholderia unamae]
MHNWLEPKYLAWLEQGFFVTLMLSACAALCATPLGFLLAVARTARSGAVTRAAALYVFVFRNSPLLVQLLFWYFGAAAVLPADWMTWLNTPHVATLGPLTLRWPSFELFAGWVGLTCYTTAFIGEEFLAGMRGVSHAQWQAAAALGMGRYATLRHVILPQALRIATPPLAGQYMNVIKNSSLTMAIGVGELSYMSRQVDTESFRTFQAFGTATVFYILAIAVIEVALVLWQRTGQRAWQRGRA